MSSTKNNGQQVQTSDVLGYFNNNTYPVSITSDQLGINYQVAPKSYVKDREDRNINDPKLDYYTKTGGLLVKEFSKTPVPLVLLSGKPVQVSGATGVKSFVGNKVPVQGVINSGIGTRLPAATAQANVAPAASLGSIRAMTVAEATKSRLIPTPDRRERFDRLAAEDNSGEAAKKAPFIDQMAPAMRPIIPANIELQSADTSQINTFESQDVVASITNAAAQEAGVKLPHDIVVAAAREEEKPFAGVPYNGKTYKRAGNLMNALLKQFNGDQSLADEAFEPFKDMFPAK